MVIQAATKGSHSTRPPSGQNSSFPSAWACAITLAGPPAMSPTSQAMNSSPTTMTTVCSMSVSATAHMPPSIV